MRNIIKNLMPTPPYKKGFTLAEVLITLVIIGVIAAITIPSLINKTRNQEYVSKLKKAYSTLAQATKLIVAEEGMPRADKGGWATSGENLYLLYKKHLLKSRDCEGNVGCFEQGGYVGLNGTDQSNFNVAASEKYNFRKLVLSDGVQIRFDGISTDCSTSRTGSSNFCAWMHVDINGAKKPNTYGRDLFEFIIKENGGLYPVGCDNEETDKCDREHSGRACACKVIREDAMNY